MTADRQIECVRFLSNGSMGSLHKQFNVGYGGFLPRMFFERGDVGFGPRAPFVSRCFSARRSHRSPGHRNLIIVQHRIQLIANES